MNRNKQNANSRQLVRQRTLDAIRHTATQQRKDDNTRKAEYWPEPGFAG